jgi:hypothetical protein
MGLEDGAGVGDGGSGERNRGMEETRSGSPICVTQLQLGESASAPMDYVHHVGRVCTLQQQAAANVRAHPIQVMIHNKKHHLFGIRFVRSSVLDLQTASHI